MEKTKELLIVHTAMPRVTLQESVNVMLTPQFYTLKKEAFPVKYAYQAKKIAASLFEGLLEEGAEYEYFVSKEKDTWVFIAYDIEKIRTFLDSKGIAAQKIAKLFFAQQSVDAFTAPLSLSETEALVVIDDTVVVVPKVALGEDEKPSLIFNSDFTPKSGVNIKVKSDSSLLTEKQATSLAVVFMLFASIFLFEGSRYSGDSVDVEEKMQSLYEAHPSLKSSYTRKDISKKYKAIDKSERKKRNVIKAFSNMIFKGVTLTTLYVNEKTFKVEFLCKNAQVEKKVKEMAKKAQYKTSTAKGSTNLTIEGSL